jgi:hypothetical protein
MTARTKRGIAAIFALVCASLLGIARYKYHRDETEPPQLGMEHNPSTRTGTNQQLALNKYGFTSAWGIESISVDRLKDLPPFDAKIIEITNFIAPEIESQTNDGTNKVRYLLTLTTSQGQTFAIESKDSETNFLALLFYVRVGNSYHFPDVLFESNDKAGKSHAPANTGVP